VFTKKGYNWLRTDPASEATEQLEREGYTVLRGVLTPEEVAELHTAASDVYNAFEADVRNAGLPEDEREDFRYEMFNRNAAIQEVVGHPAILGTIDPLLGEDCHIIANTCWRNPPRETNRQGGGSWHIDAGPHVPHDLAIPWDDRIPYPVFAIGTHIFLEDCPLESGPTGVIPGSHKSGTPPPLDRAQDMDLTCYDRGVLALTAKAGDVAFFVSDMWHRRLPSGPGDTGRFFIQVHYARRDIAQRVRPTAEVNHVSDEALARATSDREKHLIGIHPRGFYDG